MDSLWVRFGVECIELRDKLRYTQIMAVTRLGLSVGHMGGVVAMARTTPLAMSRDCATGEKAHSHLLAPIHTKLQ